MDFIEFSLDEKLQSGIKEKGYVTCTPVQEQVLRIFQEEKDLYVQSQTGTGKTAAYLTSIINQMLTKESKSRKTLVVVPTRELAVQVQEEAESLCKFTDIRCGSFYGGVGYDKQIANLKKGVDIIIGTPGRVIDLVQGNQMDLSDVSYLVIDEADRMFDMGFYPDLRTLIKVLPSSETRRTMLFSATLNSYVKNLAWEYTKDAHEITIEAENITVDEIHQELFHVSSTDKIKLLLGLINREKPDSLIVFCNTKKSAEIIAKRLRLNDIPCDFIIGDMNQKKRLEIINKFKSGEIKYLVATDVAARGIDVNDLEMVINYDLPNEAENYVHRIGRTARAGKSGKAYTFCSEQDVYSLPPVERYIEKQIPSSVADPEMLIEDKSANVYIKLDSYRGDYNDKSEYGRRKQAEHERREGRGRPRGNGRYSSKNESAKSEYRRDRRVFSQEEEAMLSSLSSDERMKLYKERFAGKANSQASKDSESSKKKGGRPNQARNQNRTGGKQQRTGNQQNASSKQGSRKPVHAQSQQPKKQEKLSIFAKIKRIFKK